MEAVAQRWCLTGGIKRTRLAWATSAHAATMHGQARRDALDAARWIAEGASFRVEAVALAPSCRADATD